MFDVQRIEGYGQVDGDRGDHDVLHIYLVAEIEPAELQHCPIVVVGGRMFHVKLAEKADDTRSFSIVSRALNRFHPNNRCNSYLLPAESREPGDGRGQLS